MSDLPVIKSMCEKVLREIDHSERKELDDALFQLYSQLYKHYTLGVKVEEKISVSDRVG